MTEIVIAPTTAITAAEQMQAIGHIADHHAAQHTFADYASRKAHNTLKAQQFDLAVFADYLSAVGVVTTSGVLQGSPAAWQGMTWGIVEGFVKWMLQQGFSIGTINRRLSTVKIYAKLAAKALAGALGDTKEDDAARARIVTQGALIKSVSGYAGKEAKRVNERREVTRVGHKKVQHVSISPDQAKALKAQPDTPQGRRDAVIMALLLDLGLRVGELAILEVDHVNLKAGTIKVHRPKVSIDQTHKLSADCLVALRNWFDSGDCSPFGQSPLLRGSRKGGALTEVGMCTTSISERVRSLGSEIGVTGLSAHDCRHYWTSYHVNSGKPLNQIRQAGGWSTLTMVQRYAEESVIANEGLV